MKKKYISPDLEIILLQSGDVMTDIDGSDVDPWSIENPARQFQQYLNDLPNGTILDEDGYEKR